MRELNSRVTDGLHVRLLWSKADDRTTVAALDTKTGDAFLIEVRRGEQPLDVFHHPFAYAARRGIEIGAEQLPPPWPHDGRDRRHRARGLPRALALLRTGLRRFGRAGDR